MALMASYCHSNLPPADKYFELAHKGPRSELNRCWIVANRNYVNSSKTRFERTLADMSSSSDRFLLNVETDRGSDSSVVGGGFSLWGIVRCVIHKTGSRVVWTALRSGDGVTFGRRRCENLARRDYVVPSSGGDTRLRKHFWPTRNDTFWMILTTR